MGSSARAVPLSGPATGHRRSLQSTPRPFTPHFPAGTLRQGTQSPAATADGSRTSLLPGRALGSGSLRQAETAAFAAPCAQRTRAAARDVRMQTGKKITQGSFTEKAWQAIVAAPEVRTPTKR